jgi:hypothetical protein
MGKWFWGSTQDTEKIDNLRSEIVVDLESHWRLGAEHRTTSPESVHKCIMWRKKTEDPRRKRILASMVVDDSIKLARRIAQKGAIDICFGWVVVVRHRHMRTILWLTSHGSQEP